MTDDIQKALELANRWLTGGSEHKSDCVFCQLVGHGNLMSRISGSVYEGKEK